MYYLNGNVISLCFQESESLFHFIEPDEFNNLNNQHNDGSTTSKKRKQEDSLFYSYIKTSTSQQGRKVIKLEIFDANNYKNEEMCKCNAEICCQQVVKNLYKDDVYRLAQELIEKISDLISGQNKFTF